MHTKGVNLNQTTRRFLCAVCRRKKRFFVWWCVFRLIPKPKISRNVIMLHSLMALCVCVSLCLQINGKQTSMCNTKSVFKIKIKTQNRHANTMDQITSEPSWAAPPEQNDTRDIFLEAWMISGRTRSVFFEGTKTRKMISNCRKSAEDEACAFDRSMCEVFVFVFAPFSVGSYMFCVFGTFFEVDFF